MQEWKLFRGLFKVHRPRTIEDMAAKAVLRSSIRQPIPLDDFLPRPDLSARINDAIDKSKFVVIEGPRGCGKTSLVRDALSSRTGVVHFSTRSHLDPSSEVLKALSETLDPWRTARSAAMPPPLTKDQLAEVCRKAIAQRQPPDASWRPTIVVETDVMGAVGDHGGLEITESVRYRGAIGALKELSAEKLANVVVVLSDDDAAFVKYLVGVDHLQLWVDDFSEAEAHAYLDKVETLPWDRTNAADTNLALRSELFHELGTRPVSLMRAASEWQLGSLDEWISYKQMLGESDVRGLVHYSDGPANGNGAAFRRLIDDLLETTDKIGVPIERAQEYLARPDDIRNVYLRKGMPASGMPWHTVLYHRPTGTFRFNSADHRRAAERLFGSPLTRG